ncbi:MAG: hypothetical protein NC341_09320 [Blautia sp.]|nr:hypothetical protein [Blautia sp.]MCM1201915.1 hypothetical protein [Bacteroides fragilis]
MKFISLSKSQEIMEKNILMEEFKAAVRAGEGRMGQKHLFYRYFINARYISYQKIQKAYLRVESGESGEFLLKEFYLILKLQDGTEGKLRFEREENAKRILTHLEEQYPHIEIGYKKKNKQHNTLT